MARRSNVYMIRNGNMTLLVDTSVSFDRRVLYKRILAVARDRLPEFIILTHSHFDHAANAAFLKSAFESKIVIHESEAGFLKDGYSPLPDILPFPLRMLNRFDRNKLRPLVSVRPAEADILVGDEMDLSLTGIPVILRHMPGHTNGSLIVFVDDEIAIVGDNMVHMPGQKVFPPFCDNVPALLDTWKKLLDGNCRLFLPAHGKEISREILSKAFVRAASKAQGAVWAGP